MVPCLHQSNVYIKRKIHVWSVQNCIPPVDVKTELTCAWRETTPSHVNQYRDKNGNLKKSGSTYRHGTVFAPKECLYEEEATNMESPKMHSSSRCKNRTYLCRTANYPVSCKAEWGREWQFPEIRVYLSPWYRVAPKQCLYEKEAIGMESPKMHSFHQCKNRTYLCGVGNYPVSCKPVYRAENGKLGKSGSTFRHGIMSAPKHCLYQK